MVVRSHNFQGFQLNLTIIKIVTINGQIATEIKMRKYSKVNISGLTQNVELYAIFRGDFLRNASQTRITPTDSV